MFGVLLILCACQPAPQPQAPIASTPLHKHAHATRYAIDPLRSAITLRVYRDGPLARFGHNHVIVATQIQGMVYREAVLPQSEVELQIPVGNMMVDSPDDRASAGADFPGVLPPEAIADTRQHMLGPQLLAAEQYPQITLHSVAISGEWPDLQFVVEVNVRNLTSQLVLPVHMAEVEKTLIADGSIKISQVQLGLKPYSVLGGGLRVGDNIDAQFHIVATQEL
jgi:polyisoprenoid-binding protein YceI